MEIVTHNINDIKTAEIVADETILASVEDGLDLLGDLYYQGYDCIIIPDQNISEKFFDLKTKLAGEVLQKFVQYRVSLIIIGDFLKYTSKSLNDFIYESNKGRHINFVTSLSEALARVPKSKP
ncbi:DUF4180 domain-containing protein [Pedobacter sp. JY14-1]|uniref:DUF4180 domain-containing protein n=1 Tax=Pedobacter sp. JY14-1 TaxID=3034151 RepID=UPI0023E1227A|nr:DUF4180 domain-containing protein [Pedobacter sp. JY14-1]